MTYICVDGLHVGLRDGKSAFSTNGRPKESYGCDGPCDGPNDRAKRQNNAMWFLHISHTIGHTYLQLCYYP